MTTPASKSVKTGWKRHNISLSKETRKKGAELEKYYRRKFSNLVGWLVDQEHARIFPLQPKPQGA